MGGFFSQFYQYPSTVSVKPNSRPVADNDSRRLTHDLIPDSLDFDAVDSCFFKNYRSLPTPAEVRARARAQHESETSVDERRVFSSEPGPQRRPPPAFFQKKNLLVKWGAAISILEAQSLLALRRKLGSKVPVPEVYGWRTDGGETFLYMEYVRGIALDKVWDDFDSETRLSVCEQLRDIWTHIRSLEQDPSDRYIGLSCHTSSI